MEEYLKTLKPTIIQRVKENFTEYFSLPQQPIVIREYNGSTNKRPTYLINSSQTEVPQALIIPPLNTDIRFVENLPAYDLIQATSTEFNDQHPHKPHTHETYAENFSWHLITAEDSNEVVAKKKLIHPVQNQYMCGSCWAMCAAATMSDCFVASGIINWAPRISATYIMMCLPPTAGNGQCDGGNPATVVSALERTPICDTTCIDYSWCSNDKTLCTSADAAQHFQSTLGSKLNAEIPKTCGCYFAGDRYAYTLDTGSNVFHIDDQTPTDLFRQEVKAHIVDFGPPMGGYAVLRNFVTGNFTDESVNQGVYFDRCNYDVSISAAKPLTFDDGNASDDQLNGFHAVSVIGWGLAKNIQYDNDKYGDVPFWWCRNSWGPEWGNANGYFKIAMYPFNQYAQFDKPVSAKGSAIGGMILTRATAKPAITTKSQIEENALKLINRKLPDKYYKQTPDDFSKTVTTSSPVIYYVIIGCIIIIIVIIYVIIRKQNL
jgi:hypothetical protein